MKRITLLMALLFTIGIKSQLFAQIPNPAPYCDASFDDGFAPVADQIKVVSFGPLINPTNAQAPAPHYTYYNNLPQSNFKVDSAYYLNVVLEVHGFAGYGVWIDYNHDNQFSPNEKVSGTDSATGLFISNSTLITDTITIPSSAPVGKTRMRVRIVEDDNYTMAHGANILPCNVGNPIDSMDWGETEDYDVYITAPTGIKKINNETAISLYPNPAHTFINVTTKLSTPLDYKIYDITGNVIKQATLTNKSNSIDISKFTNGLYFIRILESGNILGQYKFVKRVNN